jgi:serine/threonine protein kinase
MRRLNHPTLCKLLKVYDYRTYTVLVLEHIHGGTLSDKIKSSSIEIDQALLYTSDILDALSYMHSMNIIHRDIKSTNVMFDVQENGREVLKLIDFGLVGDLSDKT